MELTLALMAGIPADPGQVPAPGTDPADAASQAFAALLATLVAGVLPMPVRPEAVALPIDVTSTVAPAAPEGEAPAVAVAVLPLALALPAAATAPPLALTAAPTPPAEAPASAAETPEVTAAVPASSSPAPLEQGGGRDEEPEVAPRPVAAPTATQLPQAVAPAAATTFSSPAPPPEGGERDQDAVTPTVAAATRTAEVLKPEIVAGPGAPAPVGPEPPVSQVVKAVLPLRHLADGTHKLVLELNPDQLGTVRVEVSLDAGVVHLGLRAEVDGTGQLLRAALPELRAQLDAAGLTAGRVAVDSDGGQRHGQPSWVADDRTPRRTPAADLEAALDDQPVRTAYSSAAHGHVDVLL